MRTPILFSLALLAAAAPGRGAESRFTAPRNIPELDARVTELRAQYAPFLRSLPPATAARPRIALPKEWKFTFEAKESPKVEGVPPAPAWFGAAFDDSKWSTTTVPEWRYRMREGDTALDPKDVAVCVTKGRSADTICWYRTVFPAAPPPAGRRQWLCFDGVDWEAQVYLNGELLGSHAVYYEPFRFDVTARLRATNSLAVRVIDGRSYGEPVSYWAEFPDIRAAEQRYVPDRAQSIRGNLPIGYHAGTGFGIHREAYLEESGPVLVAAIFARNDLSGGAAHVKVELDAAAAGAAELRVDVLPENFEGPAFSRTLRCELPRGASAQTLEIPMPGAQVWAPDAPHLYRCRVTVPDSDAKDALFGCRSFSVVNRKEPAAPAMPTYTFPAVKAHWLRILGRGSDASDWESIWDVSGPAIRRGKEHVSASGSDPKYPAAYALDGDPKTRWAMEGRGHWIQFRLDETIAFDRVTIGWFAAESRTWDFDLLVSDDGRQWTKLDYAAPGAAAAAAGELPNGMLRLNGAPVYLRGSNIAGLNAYWYWGQREELLHALLLLKAGHFNAVRNCQHVQFPEVRELLDRMGMMSEQDQGGGYRGSIDMGVRRAPHIRTGTALARACYNNPGVVLLSFGNEHQFDTTPILRAALAEDPQRVFKPISGRFTHSGGQPLSLPDELWDHVIDDGHPYSGWYGKVAPQSWSFGQVFSPRRLVTLGEFGAEALDAYETMRGYPPQFAPPPPGADTLWAASQVQRHDVKQIAGLGRNPTNLAEYIEASQNWQESLLADKVTGMRLSPRAIAGYFHFHFLDVVPVFWPKAIVSFDHRPKKAYFQLAQLNQPLVALAQLSGARPDAMTLWIANDLAEAFPKATLHWTVDDGSVKLLAGQDTLDVPALGVVKGQAVDLTPVAAKHAAFEIALEVADRGGRLLSRYTRQVRVVPAELLKPAAAAAAADPFKHKK